MHCTELMLPEITVECDTPKPMQGAPWTHNGLQYAIIGNQRSAVH